jgi:hypothetical protein
MGLIYGLGGFYLSTLNLVVYLQAAAWAPLLVLTLRRAASGGPRQWAAAAVVSAISASSLGVEVVFQAVAFGVVISMSTRDPLGRLCRMGLGIGLGAGLAAPVLGVLAGLSGVGARAGGLPMDMVLAFSVHPVALAQVVINGLFGEVPTSLRAFWGHRFFAGFPYFLSLYLGVAVIAVASVGLLRRDRLAWRVAAMGALGLVVSLGPTVGLRKLIELAPVLQAFRFPSKAFFLVHLSVAVLAGLGLHRLLSSRSAWKTLAWICLLAGAALAASPALPMLAPEAMAKLGAAFFPAAYSASRRAASMQSLLADAAVGGSAAIAVGLIGLLAARTRLTPVWGVAAVVTVIAADLVRAGIGLNPMVTAEYYRPSPQMRAVASRVGSGGGRLFTCPPTSSRRLIAELNRSSRRRDDIVTMLAVRESLTPHHNMAVAVLSAYGRDTSGMLPANRALTSAELSCATFAALPDRLRRAGVTHVLSIDPIAGPGVKLEQVLRPPRLAPLTMALYAIEPQLPLREVAREARVASSSSEAEALAASEGFQVRGATAVEGLGNEIREARGRLVAAEETADELRFIVEADRPTVLVVRDAWAPGWVGRVDGAPAPVLRADGRHRAIPIPAGRSEVVLSYRPPGLRLGCAVGLACLAVVVVLGLWGGRAGRVRIRGAGS